MKKACMTSFGVSFNKKRLGQLRKKVQDKFVNIKNRKMIKFLIVDFAKIFCQFIFLGLFRTQMIFLKKHAQMTHVQSKNTCTLIENIRNYSVVQKLNIGETVKMSNYIPLLYKIRTHTIICTFLHVTKLLLLIFCYR